MTMTPEQRQAYELGVTAAKAAASWTVDGNTTQEHIRRVLAMLDDGDPSAYDYLPCEPNLSGEYADDPTPQSIARNILGVEVEELPEGGELTQELVEAWELGVSETFSAECEAELHRALNDED